MKRFLMIAIFSVCTMFWTASASYAQTTDTINPAALVSVTVDNLSTSTITYTQMDTTPSFLAKDKYEEIKHDNYYVWHNSSINIKFKNAQSGDKLIMACSMGEYAHIAGAGILTTVDAEKSGVSTDYQTDYNGHVTITATFSANVSGGIFGCKVYGDNYLIFPYRVNVKAASNTQSALLDEWVWITYNVDKVYLPLVTK